MTEVFYYLLLDKMLSKKCLVYSVKMFSYVIIHIGVSCYNVVIDKNKYYTTNVQRYKVLTHKLYLLTFIIQLIILFFLTIFSYQVISL